MLFIYPATTVHSITEHPGTKCFPRFHCGSPLLIVSQQNVLFLLPPLNYYYSAFEDSDYLFELICF